MHRQRFWRAEILQVWTSILSSNSEAVQWACQNVVFSIHQQTFGRVETLQVSTSILTDELWSCSLRLWKACQNVVFRYIKNVFRLVETVLILSFVKFFNKIYMMCYLAPLLLFPPVKHNIFILKKKIAVGFWTIIFGQKIFGILSHMSHNLELSNKKLHRKHVFYISHLLKQFPCVG